MDKEKLHGMQLNDSDLDPVWGGQGVQPAQKIKCDIFPPAEAYTSCPNLAKGSFKECEKCRLNV